MTRFDAVRLMAMIGLVLIDVVIINVKAEDRDRSAPVLRMSLRRVILTFMSPGCSLHLRLLLKSLQQHMVAGDIIVYAGEKVTEKEYNEILMWSKVELRHCSGPVVWLTALSSALEHYESAVWVDNRVLVDSEDLERIFTVVENHGHFIAETKEASQQNCTSYQDLPLEAAVP
eukprot:1973153-Rhodomonas_salina.1